MSTNPFTVSSDWLHAHIDDPDVSIVDASWYLPTMLSNGIPRDGKSEFDTQHIPGAVFFDIDAITEPGSTLPHTLASAEVFADKMSALGISEQNTIVVYDGMGLFSAPRAWWNFRVMGAARVMILDGGLPKWLQENLPVTSDAGLRTPKTFNAKFDHSTVVSFNEMKSIVSKGDGQVVDARPEGRFAGADPEPRPGVRSGHMPGANSVPFSALANHGQLRSPDELRQVFASAGINLDEPVATTCGSGVTAAALTLALETIGHQKHVLYDGSWAEWGGRDDTEIVQDD